MNASRVDEDSTLQTPVYITSHCSPKSYEVSYPSNYTKIDNGDKYYQVITYTSDKITIESYNSSHTQIDMVEITSNYVYEVKE